MKKTKTSFTLPPTIDDELQEMSELLGVSKSDVVAVALVWLSPQLSMVRKTAMKRKMALRRVGREFQKMMDSWTAKLDG